MQNFYRNFQPFFNNNLYKRNLNVNRFPYHYSNNTFSHTSNTDFSNTSHVSFDDTLHSNSYTTSTSNPENIQQNNNLPPNKDFVVDLFGLKLYFDDILILSLLFFLYKEEVKDEGLFLALVLLLIS